MYHMHKMGTAEGKYKIGTAKWGRRNVTTLKHAAHIRTQPGVGLMIEPSPSMTQTAVKAAPQFRNPEVLAFCQH